MQKISKVMKSIVIYIAKRTASLEANTACTCLNYQPKELQSVKNCVNFEVNGIPSKFLL